MKVCDHTNGYKWSVCTLHYLNTSLFMPFIWALPHFYLSLVNFLYIIYIFTFVCTALPQSAMHFTTVSLPPPPQALNRVQTMIDIIWAQVNLLFVVSLYIQLTFLLVSRFTIIIMMLWPHCCESLLVVWLMEQQQQQQAQWSSVCGHYSSSHMIR